MMDSSNDQTIVDKAVLSPIKKNKRGEIIGSRERLRILNMYKANFEKDPNMSMRKMRQIISESVGIGETTVHRTINKYKETNTVTSPNRKRVRKSVLNLYDDFARDAVRKHTLSIWCRREIPTVDKIHKAVSEDESLPPISRTNLYRLLKELQIELGNRNKE